MLKNYSNQLLQSEFVRRDQKLKKAENNNIGEPNTWSVKPKSLKIHFLYQKFISILI